jgi:imidazolonepropionase-like amidohydrolase
MRHLMLAAIALVAVVRQPASPAIAIERIAIVDAVTGAVLPDRTVVVEGDRIASVGLSPAARAPSRARIFDGSGKFLIPGLWDMHSHAVTFGPSSLALYLANGVTGIRDMGAERFADAKAWRDRIAAGTLEGPRMRIASPIVENARWLAAVREMNERAGTRWTLHERVGPRSPAEAADWVDSLAALGPDHIKVRNWPEPEIGRALVDRARERGLPVFAHGNEPFPRSGLATLEHSVWPPIVSEERRADLWRQLAANGVAVVPTMVTWPARLDPPQVLIEKIEHERISGIEYVAAAARARWRDQLRQFQQERPMDWTAIHQAAIRDVREMRQAGLSLLPGTDTGAPLVVPGFSLHAELELMVRVAGLTPAQALEAATIRSARGAGLGDALGSIAVGHIADLVVLDANPLVDIANTKRIAGVVANGRLLDRTALDRLLASAAAAGHK